LIGTGRGNDGLGRLRSSGHCIGLESWELLRKYRTSKDGPIYCRLSATH